MKLLLYAESLSNIICTKSFTDVKQILVKDVPDLLEHKANVWTYKEKQTNGVWNSF